MELFSIENLTFSYPGAPEPALRNVSLRIEAGSYTLLCGPTGSGKTTLLRQLKTVLTPFGEVSGRVLLDGVPLSEVGLREQAARIGFVLQNPDAQIVTDKVWHELAFGLENLGCDPEVMRVRVAEMASYFGIQHWFRQDVSQLSGGQKQLLNLAAVMALQPDVLVLDEPTSQLDPIAASDFLATVKKLNRELGTTVVVTEHRLEEVFPQADSVVIMENGGVALAGSPRDVGQKMLAAGSPLAVALPSPLRIWHGVTGASEAVSPATDASLPAGDVSYAQGEGIVGNDAAGHGPEADEGRCECALPAPLTVRQGRRWLAHWCDTHPLRTRSLPETGAGGTDAASANEAASNIAVEMKEVWFRYGRELPDVLQGASLSVREGQVHVLLGGNGTGKTTALRVLTGALKPYRGKVALFGRKLKDWRPGQLFRGGLALLPQDPSSLFVKDSLGEDLEEMLVESDATAAERREAIAEVARLCRVQHLLASHPFDLSGGEQQRAALAKVLLTRPRLLLLDEPTKGVDAMFKQQLGLLLRQLSEEGTTVLLVSHDVEFCARWADEASLFFDGAVASTNPPRRFFSENSFYTTAANRMSRGQFANAVTDEDVVSLCLQK